MSKINYEFCKTEIFEWDKFNEFFVAKVEDGKSSKGDYQWLVHLLPMNFKDEKENQWGKFKNGIIMYIQFDTEGNIKHARFKQPLFAALSKDGERNYGKVLEKAVKEESTIWIKCELKTSEYDGKVYTKYEPVEYRSDKPSKEEEDMIDAALKEKNNFNKGLDKSMADKDLDDDDLPF